MIIISVFGENSIKLNFINKT